jgi:hypothetical protein
MHFEQCFEYKLFLEVMGALKRAFVQFCFEG